MKKTQAEKPVKASKAAPKKRAAKAKPELLTLTKHRLAETIAEKTGIRYPEVMQIIQMSFDEITDTVLQGGRAEFRNFGIFSCVVRKSSIGRNPKRPEDEVIIPSRKIVKFKPGKIMSDASKKVPTTPRKAKKTSNLKKKEK